MASAIRTNLPCNQCGSSDAGAEYPDGFFCFSCESFVPNDSSDHKSSVAVDNKNSLLPQELKELFSEGSMETKALKKRMISLETTSKWKVKIGKYCGRSNICFNNYSLKGKLVSIKTRNSDKDIKYHKFIEKPPLYGQWLWKEGGKMIVITEGEIDALTVSQLYNNKWPVVSINRGAGNGYKDLKDNLDYLLTFEKVVVMFDNDRAGKEGLQKILPLFPYGKLHIAELPLKDPNDMLLAHKGAEVIKAIWEAKPFKPEEIVQGSDLKERIKLQMKSVKSFKYPFKCLNAKTFGVRKGELVTITAGSGLGKSTLSREIAYDLAINQNVKIAYVALEESILMSMLSFISIFLDIPVHFQLEQMTFEDVWEMWEQLPPERDNIIFYDHFGSLDNKSLLDKFRYIALGAEAEIIFLDHLSIVVSGQADGDERRNIDNLMTNLKTLTETVGVGIVMISHLKDSEGKKAYEEGAVTHLNALRGSRSIGQLSNTVIGLERNQQSDDEEDRNVMIVRILKCRWTGLTGETGFLKFDFKTNRLSDFDYCDREDNDPFGVVNDNDVKEF